MTSITLPEPPSANRYWRHVGAKVLLSKEARQYRQDVLVQWLQRPAKDRQRLSGEIAVTLTWYRSRKVGDLDNRIKQVLDALRECAYHDDSQIVAIRAYRQDDKANPRVELILSEIPA